MPTSSAHHSPLLRRHEAVTRPSSSARLARALTLVALPVLGLLAPWAARPIATGATGYDWTQFDGNAQHSGNNTMETTITPANVQTLTRLFQVSLPAVADGPPAYLSDVATANGTQDLLFLTTKDGQTLARDAHTGAPLWSHQYGPNGCKINNGSSDCYTTSAPAVDPARQYVYSYGLDGKAHKYAVGDGTEVTTGGWPETTTLKGYDEKGSSDLTVATTGGGASAIPYLYVTHGGYPGDRGDYQGHVTSINLNTGSQTVFNADCSTLTTHLTTQANNDCSNVQNAIWARAGVTYDAQTNRVYMSTGNGTFDPTHDTWGDTLFALNPDGTGQGNGNPLLTYTPVNYQDLKNRDADLGSTAPVLLPPPTGSAVTHLGLQSDKDAKLRLLNLDTLSGGTGNTGGEIAITGVPQGGEVLTQPAVWTNPADGSTWTFVANDQGLSALKVTLGSGGQPGLSTMWQTPNGGTSPIIANNVLYDVGGGGLRALDPTTGNQLWADTSISRIHWESPIVANGVLYTTDDSGTLTAYGLPGAPTSTPTTVPALTATATATATNSPVPPTATSTPLPPTATSTPLPPTATATATSGTVRGVAIDSGGGATGSFVADTDVSGGNTYANGTVVDAHAVTNPAPQAVYQSERYGAFTYTVPHLTPGAAYTVRLHFAEIYWTAAGKRVFNVAINGAPVLRNFDIVAATGGANRATVREFQATADSGGTITIAYTAVRDNAKSSGIEIVPHTGLDAGLVGRWQFDEGVGATTADASGSGDNGTLQGGAGWAAGKYGDALALDGATGYVAAGVNLLPAANAAQSISWWLNVPAIPGGVANVLSLTNDAHASAVQPGFRGGQVGVWKYGGTWLVSAPPPAAGSWHHYAYTFDGATHRLYIDGALAASSTVMPQTAGPTTLEFGRWTGGSEYLTGSVDDVRIYNRALSASDVLALAGQP